MLSVVNPVREADLRLIARKKSQKIINNPPYKFRVWDVDAAKHKYGHSEILEEIRNGCRMEMEDVFRSVLRFLHEMAECRTAD